MSAGWIEWAALAERATLAGVEVGTLPRSELLDAIAEDLLDRWDPTGIRVEPSWCQHFGGLGIDDRPTMLVFVAQMSIMCPECAPGFRDEIEAGRKRACIGCDEGRAAGLHRALFAPDPNMAHLELAVQLCDGCAAAEGLTGTALGGLP